MSKYQVLVDEALKEEIRAGKFDGRVAISQTRSSKAPFHQMQAFRQTVGYSVYADSKILLLAYDPKTETYSSQRRQFSEYGPSSSEIVGNFNHRGRNSRGIRETVLGQVDLATADKLLDAPSVPQPFTVAVRISLFQPVGAS